MMIFFDGACQSLLEASFDAGRPGMLGFTPKFLTE